MPQSVKFMKNVVVVGRSAAEMIARRIQRGNANLLGHEIHLRFTVLAYEFFRVRGWRTMEQE